MRLQGLLPIVGSAARVLILGSFPSETSLQQQQYYAHPRNQFWHIMECLFGIARGNPYPQRCQQLVEHDIALWDVLQSCQRQGSMDSKIRTPEVNDLAGFYKRYGRVSAVFWNGAAAEKYYREIVGMVTKPVGQTFTAVRLPSSSPANATISLSGKVAQWKAVCDALATDD